MLNQPSLRADGLGWGDEKFSLVSNASMIVFIVFGSREFLK